jgi:hypothetical protein
MRLRTIWKDAVWSKVIAWAIIGIIGSIGVILWRPGREVALGLLRFLQEVRDFLWENPFALTSAILLMLVVALYSRLRRVNHKQSERVGLQWIESLREDELVKYVPILLWFPANRTLKSPKYYVSSESLDHVPEIVELVEHRVLTIVIETVVHFSVQIDKEVCRKLEQEIIQNQNQLPGDKQKQIKVLRSIDFRDMFRTRGGF